MPKFHITTTFGLATTVEPDGVRMDDFDFGYGEIMDDGCYFDSGEVEVSGGRVEWEVVAEDESAAERLAEDAVYDGAEVTDYHSITWVVTDVSHEIEIEIKPMTLERARAILTATADNMDDEEVAVAVGFVFDTLHSMEARLTEANLRIDGLIAAATIPPLASEIISTLPDSGAPTE